MTGDEFLEKVLGAVGRFGQRHQLVFATQEDAGHRSRLFEGAAVHALIRTAGAGAAGRSTADAGAAANASAATTVDDAKNFIGSSLRVGTRLSGREL
jgi:hypothetical protein